jgi:hypothetical protein
MSEAKLREELYNSFKNRAMIYYNMYNTLSAALGKDKAAELMMDAIYKRGVEQSKVLQGIDNQDVKTLMDKFLAIIPDDGKMFGPEILKAEADAVDIKFHRCPLKECWLEAGIPETEVAELCRIAARVDNGLFEGAGFNFHAETWEPGRDGCCHLHLRPGG